MKTFVRTVAVLLVPLSGLAQTGQPSENPKLTLAALQEQANRFGTVLTAFDWETTPEQIAQHVDEAIKAAAQKLTRSGSSTQNN
jgi:hypothetical protein